MKVCCPFSTTLRKLYKEWEANKAFFRVWMTQHMAIIQWQDKWCEWEASGKKAMFSKYDTIPAWNFLTKINNLIIVTGFLILKSQNRTRRKIWQMNSLVLIKDQLEEDYLSQDCVVPPPFGGLFAICHPQWTWSHKYLDKAKGPQPTSWLHGIHHDHVSETQRLNQVTSTNGVPSH